VIKAILSRLTDTLHELPVLVLMPHSRCNCRCVMCDIWKANQQKKEITTEEFSRHVESFRRLGVKYIALSGGEALMHTNLWRLCEMMRSAGMHISLLSTGMTLAQHSANVVKHVDEVIVSLDGPPEVHNTIRNISSAYEKLSQGVAALQKLKPDFRITGRCVLQKLNYRYFPDIVRTAQTLQLQQISFLAADVSTSAFNRESPWTDEKVVQIELNESETQEFESLLNASFREFESAYQSRFIAESPAKMLELVQYYKAMLGNASFPARKCNAPWVSAVIESDGEVRPCFFHASYGNLFTSTFDAILNSETAKAFRRKLDVKTDPICQRCVCSLHRGVLS
jgi:MoaA/NifB/PqqE/SkfB family radical SAM enzyme